MSSAPGSDPRSSPPILLVDDDQAFLLSVSVALRSAGIGPLVSLEDGRRVLPFLAERDAAVLVLDLTMPHMSGAEILDAVRELHPHIPVIVMTAVSELETAVACMKKGAFDYIVKPAEASRIVGSLRTAREMRALRDEISSLTRGLLSASGEFGPAFSAIATSSARMQAIFRYVEAIAMSDQPVLITGETGVGKELLARAVHDASGRAGKFVAVNAAGLDDAMLSDTLFGHRKGAYTGAVEAREGLIAQAAAGTLFLDEIGDLKESSQVKLLRLLEERTYYPLGADVPRSTDARIVCATCHDLRFHQAAGKFRKDLFYRLAGHQVHIPPLRERPEDIPVLVDRFLEEASASLGKKKPAFPPELITLLSAHGLPGNVRELRTMVFDAVARHGGGVLSTGSFRLAAEADRAAGAAGSSPTNGSGDAPVALPARFPTLKEAEVFLIEEALRRSGNNQGVAASLLGISRQALNKRLARKPLLRS